MASKPEPRSPAAMFDILHCIISYLDPEPYTNTKSSEATAIRKALVGLATTHSTFTKPALSALWRSLSGDDALNHLLCVVGVAKEVPMENGWSGPHLELCGSFNPCAPGWKRFQEYATFVRKIVVNVSRVTKYTTSSSEFTILLHNTFWCQMATILGNAPILPHLTAMHFFSLGSDRDIDMGALRLLNPSVQELTIEFYAVYPNHRPRLKAAFTSCFSSIPNLQRLSLILPYSPLDLDILPQSHPRLRYLRVVQPISPHCLISIASLPDLESLSICIMKPVNIPVLFKKLRALSITRGDLDKAASLIAFTEAPRLRNLSINSSHLDSVSLRTELLQCLDPLVSRFPSLTAFEWRCRQFNSCRSGYHGSRDPCTTLAELIEPLLSLRALRDLSLDIDGPIVPYSSTDFRRMAEAWPDLEALSLNLDHPLDSESAGSGDGPIQYANVDSLASFARICPRLRELRISRVFIDSITDIPSLVPPSGSEHHATGRQLRLLQVGKVLCPGAFGWKDGPRMNEVFREMIMPVFPFAALHLSMSIIIPAS